jgi:hypothetical protein
MSGGQDSGTTSPNFKAEFPELGHMCKQRWNSVISCGQPQLTPGQSVERRPSYAPIEQLCNHRQVRLTAVKPGKALQEADKKLAMN